MKPHEIYALTPREYYILMHAQQERKFDQYDDMASSAMMIGKVRSAKKSITKTDLFKRPKSTEEDGDISQEAIEKQRNASEWLSNFNIS
ncbi:hypothetical protein [Bacillus atrophaeus]|uniref:hypothetical protein n=1 Tax=Bacillus atrophaeus TaxID=1452 RepID=UPI001C632338|nr:hypothetical protein [Bacillus atrophaeus]QYG88354.1 hypothetical protein HCU65_07635 [Bacillus atrophaeus]